MKTQDNKTYVYEKNQLMEVICRLHFPTILSIEAKPPADFQDLIRENFPGYDFVSRNILRPDGEKETIKAHRFISADGGCKLELTKNSIAFSTVRYSSWQDFTDRLDEPLAHFINIYKPAYFERIGLRYVNGISREKLGLEDCQWRELIAAEYLGVLAGEGVDERSVNKCSVDVERSLDAKLHLRLHAGPGHIKRNVRSGNAIHSLQEKEVRFIFDIDISSLGKSDVRDAPNCLESIHNNADKLFSSAVSDKLHQAMEPVLL